MSPLTLLPVYRPLSQCSALASTQLVDREALEGNKGKKGARFGLRGHRTLSLSDPALEVPSIFSSPLFSLLSHLLSSCGTCSRDLCPNPPLFPPISGIGNLKVQVAGDKRKEEAHHLSVFNSHPHLLPVVSNIVRFAQTLTY